MVSFFGVKSIILAFYLNKICAPLTVDCGEGSSKMEATQYILTSVHQKIKAASHSVILLFNNKVIYVCNTEALLCVKIAIK